MKTTNEKPKPKTTAGQVLRHPKLAAESINNLQAALDRERQLTADLYAAFAYLIQHSSTVPSIRLDQDGYSFLKNAYAKELMAFSPFPMSARKENARPGVEVWKFSINRTVGAREVVCLFLATGKKLPLK